MSGCAEGRFVLVEDVLPEWRAELEFVDVPKRSLPKIRQGQSELGDTVLICDSLGSACWCGGTQEVLENFSNSLAAQIGECVRAIESADSKRREISAGAELLHGICDSHIVSEQNLGVFVKSIDRIMRYFDDFDRISVDFRSPMFTVLSPDFPRNVEKILKGIEFFEQNGNIKESRIMLAKYRILQKKASELLKSHVEKSLASAVATSRNGDFYAKFKLISGPTKRLFALMENSSEFLEILDVYRNARVELIKHPVAQIAHDLSNFRNDLNEFCQFVQREYELSETFFRYQDCVQYKNSFEKLVDDLADVFCLTISNIVYQTSDCFALCEFVQSSNFLLPSDMISSNVIENRLKRLVMTGQERLVFRIQINQTELAQSDNFIPFVHNLHQSLPENLGNDCISTLLLEYLKVSKERAKLLEGLSGSAFLLSRLLPLKNELEECTFPLIGVQKTGWLFFGMGSEIRIDLRKQISSDILLCYQAIGSNVTQFLMHPILNLKARGINGFVQINSAVEGVIVSLDSFYIPDVSEKLKEYLNQEEYETVLNALKEHMILTLGDCTAALGNVSDEAMKLIDNLKRRIMALS